MICFPLRGSIQSVLYLIVGSLSFIFAEEMDIRLSQGLEISHRTFLAPSNIHISYKNISIDHRSILFHVDHPTERFIYQNYERRNISLVTDISKLTWKNSWSNIAIGRGYIRLGPETYNSPLFSSYSPSLDHISATFDFPEMFNYQYLLIRLDDRQDEEGAYKRWIYARRLQLNFGKKWSFGIKDVVLATGVQRGIDLNYINPAAIFQMEQLHESVESGTRGANNDNQLLGIDIVFKLDTKNRIYLDFILDEFQVDTADRDLLQDVFGIVIGHNNRGDKILLSNEVWLASPWLYTNGGAFTNVEYNDITLGLMFPNSYGYTFSCIKENKKFELEARFTAFQKGEQVVTSQWDAIDNFHPIIHKNEEWEYQIDISVITKSNSKLQSIRFTKDYLYSPGYFIIATFKPFGWLK